MAEPADEELVPEADPTTEWAEPDAGSAPPRPETTTYTVWSSSPGGGHHFGPKDPD
jgi:hypothetical protein